MSSLPDSVIAGNLKRVQTQVAEAALACGRHADSVTIVTVSKYVDADATWQLIQAGGRDLGESRPQVLWEKHQQITARLHETPALSSSPGEPSGVRWHMIGHLQRNKAARTVPLMDWLHSLDSLRLAETVSTEAVKCGKRLKVLLEVNVSQDASKTGMPRSDAAGAVEKLLALPGIELRGLMAMSTDGATSDQARREFESVRQLRDDLQQQFKRECNLSELSMGMSGDFAQAIAAGATLVRIGSLLWE